MVMENRMFYQNEFVNRYCSPDIRVVSISPCKMICQTSNNPFTETPGDVTDEFGN